MSTAGAAMNVQEESDLKACLSDIHEDEDRKNREK
jgi:hypothetical protein